MPPTTAKMKFRLDALKALALASIDEHIQLKTERLELLKDEGFREAEVSAWRAEQEARISQIFRQLETIDNRSLESFRLDPFPIRDEREIRGLERALEHLTLIRSQVVAKTDSLVPDEDGTVSLTTRQMSDFFNL